jgi:hypothetical protein
MDASTLPMPAAAGVPLDRRRLVALVFGGATVAALAEAGIPVMRPWEGTTSALDSAQRIVASLAAAYDAAGPVKVGSALRRVELSMAGILATATGAKLRDARATYAQMLTMSANAANDTGDFRGAARAGDLAASLATEVGDAQTAGHAWSVVSGALLGSRRHRDALATAQRARAHAGAAPAAVMALVGEAEAAASMGRAHTVLDTVGAAEDAHARLATQDWGTTGYSLGTYHPAHLKAFTGWSLARVGIYDEAAPRLDEAADLLAGSGAALLAFVWLTQGSVALDGGDVDRAHSHVAMAVAAMETRPAAWVAGSVVSLDARSRGAFADLVEQTSRWGFTAT